ncbi:MAG: oligosaccharide flippase family protein [Thermoplasmata archaeon]
MAADGANGAAADGGPHSLESLGRGSLLSFVGQFLNLAILFGMRVELVHFLSVQQFGVLILGVSLFYILIAVLNLGVPTAVTRQIAHTRDPAERRAVMRVSVWLMLLMALLVPLVLIPTAGFWAGLAHNGQFVPVLQLLSIYLSVTLFIYLLAAFFQGHEDMLPNMLFMQFLGPLLTLGFLAAFFVLGLGLNGAVLSYVLGGSLALGLLAIYTLRRRRELLDGPGGRWPGEDPISRGNARALLAFSLPLALVGLATAAPGNADTLVVGVLQPVQVAGSYNAALALGRLVGLGITSLAFIMLPVAARLHARGDMVELRRSYATITKWILLLSVPFFILFLFFPFEALTFLYGSKVSSPAYAQAATVLIIVSLGGLIASLLGPAVAVLTAMGRLAPLVRATVISATVDVGGSFLLVPIWGPVGAAVAFAAATTILPAICLIEINTRAVVHPFTLALAKPLLAVALVFGILFGSLKLALHYSPSFFAVPVLFLAVAGGYLVAVPATRSIEAEDGHLLTVVEGYLGRRLYALRALGKHFVRSSPADTGPLPVERGGP